MCPATLMLLAVLQTRTAPADSVPAAPIPLSTISFERADAQAPAVPARERPLRRFLAAVGQDFVHFPSKKTAIWLAAGGALAAAAHPIDDDVNQHFAATGTTHHLFVPGKIIGYGWFQIGASAGTVWFGHARHEPRVVHLGIDLLRAQILTQVLTYGIKYAVRRERPDGTSGYSFPSGHASVTFASATVLQQHLGWKAAVPTYLVASYVAASRLHENRHFLSDVIFGATLGIAAGRTVTRHGRTTWTLIPTTGYRSAGIIVSRTSGGGRH